MPVIVRPAIEADARVIAEISVATWRAAFRGLMPDALLDGLAVDRREVEFRCILSRSTTPPARAAIAAAGARIVGFVVFGASRDRDAPPGTGEIHAIYVLEESWGRGIGRRLLAHARAALVADGFERLTLWTLAGAARTIGFYLALGFALDGATQVVALGGARLAHVRLTAPARVAASRVDAAAERS